jgi:hypothetical protein
MQILILKLYKKRIGEMLNEKILGEKIRLKKINKY